MNFVLNTTEEKKQMMDFIGIKSIEELFSDIDESMRLKRPLKLPGSMSEMEIMEHMRNISSLNAHSLGHTCFLGAGAYNHFIPSAVEHLISRSEFYSSYTPYQAEMSQGLLQSIFEFQTMMAELTGMDVVNASHYDGATALAESAFMAVKHSERKSIAISKAVHPEYREVVQTYAKAYGIKVIEVGINQGLTDIQEFSTLVNESTGCVIIQSPNFFGCIEDLKEIGDLAHKKGNIFITSVNEPISLGLLKPPGDLGADVVVGEAQAFGNPVNFGGPHLGFIATKGEFIKKMPGRISGLTVDTEGERGYILTLQTREQHVRRERATSNICTNQALNALAATIYLALMGKTGVKKISGICAQRAHYASKRMAEMDGFEMRFSTPFFNEFVISCPLSSSSVNKKLLKRKIIGGLELGRYYNGMEKDMLFCITEMNSKNDIDKLVESLGEVRP